MPRIAGSEIPDNKPTRIALTYLYGIGPKFAADICEELKLDPQERAKELNEDQLAAIAGVPGVKKMHKSEGRVLELLKSSSKNLSTER